MNINEILNEIGDELENTNQEAVERKLNEAAKITAEKKQSQLSIKAQGNAFNLLIILAELEESVLRQINCSKEEFELFKKISKLIDKK